MTAKKVCGFDHILGSKLENTGHVLSTGHVLFYLKHCAIGLQRSRVLLLLLDTTNIDFSMAKAEGDEAGCQYKK